jgi:hypothetical protein
VLNPRCAAVVSIEDRKEVEMRKVIVNEFMTLDGVEQSLSSPDEDASGGFEHGGWNLRYIDDISMKWLVDGVSEAGGFLLGRRTYEIFAAHWPTAPEEEQVFAPAYEHAAEVRRV